MSSLEKILKSILILRTTSLNVNKLNLKNVELHVASAFFLSNIYYADNLKTSFSKQLGI